MISEFTSLWKMGLEWHEGGLCFHGAARGCLYATH